MTHLHSSIIRPPPMNTLQQAGDLFSPLNDLCKMSNGDNHWNDEDWSLDIDQCKMNNGYTFWNDEDWSLNLFDPIFEVVKEPPLLLEEFNSSSSVSSESRKRNRNLDPGNSQEANGKVTKKQHRCPGTFYTGEPSTSRQQERLKGKTVAGMAKVYKDRISRRIKNDMVADMGVFIRIVCNMAAINASHLIARVFGSLKQIKTQWPIRPDLQHIKEKIQEIESNCKDDSLTDEAKRRLVEVGDELERLDQERLKDSTKAGNLDAVFMDFNMGTLQKELAFFSMSVADVDETTATNHLIIVDEDQDQHHGSLLTPQVLHSNFSDLKNQPYDKRQLLCHLHITYDRGSPHH